MKNVREKIKEQAELRLTPEEKNAMRQSLRAAMYGTNVGPVPSPYLRSLVLSRTITIALLIALVGGGTAYAAQSALPGDPLYRVKVNVTEPMIGALQFTPAAQASWHASVAEKRLEEAEVLAAQGKLTAPLAAQIQSNFDEHASAASHIVRVAERENPAEDGALSVRISAALSAHSTVLLALASSTATTSSDSQVIVSLAQKVHAFAEHSVLSTQERGAIGTVSMTGQSSENTEGSAEKVRVSTAVSSSATSSSSTIAVNTLSNAAKPPALAHIRSEAEAEISVTEDRLASLHDGIASASTSAQVISGLHAAKQAVITGDQAVDDRAALEAYVQALQTAVSLKTYLNADAQFPQAHLLPALLQHSKNEGGDD